MRSRKRRGGGGGGGAVAAVLGALGLGDFAHLDLRDPPEGVELSAAYDGVSGCITVSLGGVGVAASPGDLAAALALPAAAAGLAAGVDAASFSSAEAIAAVRGFVRDRVLLDGGEDCGAESEEVAAALRLVDEGKPYEVDWGALVWEVLKGEVVAGTPRRYAPYLLGLIEYQRPELFADVDRRLPLGKRLKVQQCQWTSEKLMVCDEGEEEDISVYGVSLNDGDLEEMPIFGEGEELTVDAPVDCKSAFVRGQEIHGLSQGNAEIASETCFPSDVKLLRNDMKCDDGLLHTADEQNGPSSHQHLISGTKSQPDSTEQDIIEIEDADDYNHNVGVGPSPAVFRNAPLNITPYLVQQHRSTELIYSDQSMLLDDYLQQTRANGQTPSPMHGYLQQILALVLRMEHRYSKKERACTDARAKVQCIKDEVREKECKIEAIKNEILQDLAVRSTEMRRLEHEREVMRRTVQQYRELLKKSSTKFQGYRNRMSRGQGVDCMAGEQNYALMQQMHNHYLMKEISRIHQDWGSKHLRLVKKITDVETGMANLNHEVQRLKDSILIPDLNNGMEDDFEGEAFLSKMEDSIQIEGGCVSSTKQGGKQLGELKANPHQRNDTEEGVNITGVRVSEDEAYQQGGEASRGTSLAE